MSTNMIRKQIQQGLDARTERPALASMRYERRGPACSEPGGRIRYRREDIDAWMAEGLLRPAKRRTA